MSNQPINWNELSNEEAQAIYEQQLALAREESRRQYEMEYYASQHGIYYLVEFIFTEFT